MYLYKARVGNILKRNVWINAIAQGQVSHYNTCQSLGALTLSVMAVTRGCWRAASRPVSGADSQMIFWSCLNEGWAEPPASPRITASLVVRKAPECRILSKAYILRIGFQVALVRMFWIQLSKHLFLRLYILMVSLIKIIIIWE